MFEAGDPCAVRHPPDGPSRAAIEDADIEHLHRDGPRRVGRAGQEDPRCPVPAPSSSPWTPATSWSSSRWPRSSSRRPWRSPGARPTWRRPLRAPRPLPAALTAPAVRDLGIARPRRTAASVQSIGPTALRRLTPAVTSGGSATIVSDDVGHQDPGSRRLPAGLPLRRRPDRLPARLSRIRRPSPVAGHLLERGRSRRPPCGAPGPVARRSSCGRASPGPPQRSNRRTAASLPEAAVRCRPFATLA